MAACPSYVATGETVTVYSAHSVRRPRGSGETVGGVSHSQVLQDELTKGFGISSSVPSVSNGPDQILVDRAARTCMGVVWTV